MNIKDFLIDNYIWIIVIILITIITIIGFLADKKRDKKTKEVAPSTNPNQNNTQPNNMEQMQYQSPIIGMQTDMNNNMVMNNNVDPNQTQQPMNGFGLQPNQNIINNHELGQTNSTVSMPSNANLTNNIQPVEFPTPSISQESMYQPLSEQKPNIPPHPVPDYSNNQNIVTPTDNNFNQNLNSTIPMGVPSQNIQQPAQSQPLSDSMNNNFVGGMQEFNQNNTTIPNSVNQIPVPQPVNPQPIMPNNSMDTMNPTNYNFNQNSNSTIPMGVPSQNIQQPTQPQMQNQMNPTIGMNYNTGFTGTPQPINESPTPANPNQQAPVNFVFGPQNNNQNM